MNPSVLLNFVLQKEISTAISCISAPLRWNPPCRSKGAYPPRSFNQSASTRIAQLSVAATALWPTDLLNHVKT